MKPLFEYLIVLFIVSSSFAARSRAENAPREILPLKVFENVTAGKKQTVVVYGTSLTIKGAWANSLKEYFDEQFAGQVTFANAAKAGMHSDWGVENLKERVLTKSPDLVFIEFSMN